MESNDEVNVSSHSRPFDSPGSAAFKNDVAASEEIEQDGAANIQDMKGLNNANKSPAVGQHLKGNFLSLSKSIDGSQLNNNTAAGIASPTYLTTSNFGFVKPHSLDQREFTQKPTATCFYRHNHAIGRFCFYCRGMEMPWGNILPIALDNYGNKILVAPKGAVLDGVKKLDESYEILQLALLIDFDLQLQDPATLPALLKALEGYEHLHDIAGRIANLLRDLANVANEYERERVSTWFDVLHELLKQPTLTRDECIELEIQEWHLRPTKGSTYQFQALAPAIPIRVSRLRSTEVILTREKAIENDAKKLDQAEVHRLIDCLDRNESRGPGYVQFTVDFVNWLREGARRSGRSAPQWSDNYIRQYYNVPGAPIDWRHSKPKFLDANLLPTTGIQETSDEARSSIGQATFDGSPYCGSHSKANTTPVCSEEESDVEVYDSNDEWDNKGASFRKLPEVKKNTPGRPGVEWKFLAGSDLENAELGKPDPSKFYLTRQNVDDESEIDVRQYSGISGFDWNNPQHIKNLNKARSQNRHRVNGKINETRIPWTVLEKKCLFEEVEEAIKAGQNRHNIDWEDIAERLHVRFDGVFQPKGSKLAPGVEKEPKEGSKDKSKQASPEYFFDQ